MGEQPKSDEEYDEVYIVSDLHWGGPPGGEIFAGTQAMARWIASLAQVSEARRVALVLGGDIVDFIAGPNAVYFNPDGAIGCLDAALAGVAPIVEAIKTFLDSEHARLVLLRGNHDVELALPWVSKHFVEKLSGGVGDRKKRIDATRLQRAEALSCEVGGKRVFVIHGNAQDEHNYVDQLPLDRVIAAYEERDRLQNSATSSAREIEKADRAYGEAKRGWSPNFGTRLVVDVLNFIKARRPFIDLLKPESPDALIAIVLALNPLNVAAALPFLPGGEALGTPLLEALRSRGLLRAGAGAPGDVPGVPVALPHSARSRLEQTLRDLRDDRRPLDLVSEATGADLLGLPTAIARALFGLERDEAMRDGIRDWLGAHPDFDHHERLAKDDQEIDRVYRPDIDFLVAGHTHIARCARRRGGQGTGWYLNSGTWIRLVRLHREDVEVEARWALVRRVLEAPTIAALDALGEIVRSPRNAVKIVKESDGAVVGYLGSVHDDGSFEQIAKATTGAGA
ncbi:metallophosphoesterase [Sorangium sp. So ce296]|uniref:metallophosphoesterase n=1 Tax=Sorangium sp. So ce296 TaxID=3133296 RepID=UPI003F5DBB8D